MPARTPLLLLSFAAALVVAVLAVFVSRTRAPERPPAVQPARPAVSAPPTPAAGLEAAARAPGSVEDRAPLAAEAHAEDASATAAVLAIRVVARETKAPLAGVRVRLLEGKREVPTFCAGRGSVLPGKHVKDFDGSVLPGKLVTDADGFADCAAPPGRRRTVRVGDVPHTIGPRDVEVEAPAAGLRLEVVVEVATLWTSSYFARVLDDQGAAVAEARAVVDSGLGRRADGRFPRTERRLAEARSGPDGLFELRLPDWEAHSVWVDAPGWSPVIVAADDVHASPETAHTVKLRRAASLVVHASDERGGRAGIEVVVEASGQELEAREDATRAPTSTTSFRWSAGSDAQGEAVLADLPSRVSLRLEAREGSRSLPVPEPTIVLEPGELRRVELLWHAPRAVRGRVVEGGRPLAQSKVWRISPAGDRRRSLAFYERAEQEVETDGEGRFRFEDVPAGTWWITLRAPQGNEARAPVSLPVEVVVAPDLDPPEVLLEATRAGTIRGRVLDPAGEPAAQVIVVASRDAPRELRVAHTDAEGRFEVGPLDAGRFQLGAIDPRARYAPSEHGFAEAGATDAVLRLRLGVAISGRVVDASTREPCEAEIDLIRANEQGYGHDTAQARAGTFEASGILAGAYSVCARTEDGRFGCVAGIVVTEGEKREVEIALVPGARLSLWTTSAEPVSFEAWSEGRCVATGTVTELQPANLVLPAGPVTVRSRRGSLTGEHELELTSGPPAALAIGP